MDKQHIKKVISDRLGDTLAMLNGTEFEGVIDEGFDHIADGKSTINGKPPETDDEIFICFCYYLISAIPLMQGVLGAARELSAKGDHITVSYRNQSYSYRGGDRIHPQGD